MNLFHKHEWYEARRDRCSLKATNMIGVVRTDLPGVATLEICMDRHCELMRAFIINEDMKCFEKLPETIFNDEELQQGLAKMRLARLRRRYEVS